MPSRGRKTLLLILAGALLLLVGGRLVTEVWVELLWYRALGLERVFWTRWMAALLVRSVVGLVVGAFVFWNLWVVSRSLGTIRVRRRYANIEIAERLPQGYLLAAVGLISLFSAWWISAAVGDPLGAIAALRSVSWGAVDPIFGRDLSFYVFVFPLLSGAQALAGVLLFWTVLLSVIAYTATGSIRVQNGVPVLAPAVERHLGMLLAGFLLVLAADAWLDRYALLLNGNGVGGAFGYTDHRARMPGLAAVALVALAAAAVTADAAWKQRRRSAAVAIALLAFTAIATKLVIPSVVQRFSVEPNEFPREREYIENHVAASLAAYGLGDLSTISLPYSGTAEFPSLERVRPAVAGVPLWDPRPLAVAFDQKQSLFPYYDFLSVNLDRYGAPGETEPVAIAVRELIPSELPASAQTWQNLRLRYVSGEGAVVSPVTRMASDGSPVYHLFDLDPPKLAADAPRDLELTNPNIYFGEHSPGYVILDQQVGPIGVPMGGFLRRLALAWAFQSKNIFLSDEVSSTSRIVFGRSVLERARSVAPFLFFGSDSPHPVVHRGRIVWMVDGYSASPAFPLAPRSAFAGRTVSYLRHSAKVVVDAVTGEVDVYAVAPDPILSTYGRVFPGLIRPIDEIPDDLRAHLRFPPSLVRLQAALLGEYHLTDPAEFYRKGDVWAVGTENYRSETLPIDPSFASLILPGDTAPEFVLTVPFVSRGRQNMTALMVTRNDAGVYAEQRLYLLPRDELVPGPQQVEAMIDQDPEISQQLSLWRRGGSEVIRGHLMVVPIDSTLVYVEPLFLEAQNAAIPQLERVIVAHGGRVVMRPTLDGALASLAGVDEAERRPAAASRGATTGSGAGAGPGAAALRRAQELLERADAQLRAGDWAGFGRTWELLRATLRDSDAGEGSA
jgi:uncharacterized membrane protein (UPF0182 family)